MNVRFPQSRPSLVGRKHAFADSATRNPRPSICDRQESSTKISTLKRKLSVAAPKQTQVQRAENLVKRWRRMLEISADF